MEKVTKKLFYSGLFRFQFLIFLVAICPLLTIKTVFYFYPSQIGPVINILIIITVSLAIIGSCFYALFHYFTVDKTLAPVTRMAEVGELASRVAHDLRGPLTGIDAVLYYFYQLQHEDNAYSQHLNLLELSSKRLNKITQDLLHKYKGKDEEKQTFEIHEILDELVGEFCAQPVLSGVRFFKHYRKNPITIRARRNHIERLFGNLMKNAMEAMDFEGEVHLTTSVHGETALIGIRDTGPGIKEPLLQKILSGSVTEGKKEGHGIGLVFVKEVLKRHGGKFYIDSSPGKGTEFRAELPLSKSDSSPFTLCLTEKGPVLLIDDDPSVLEQWRMRLISQGVETLCADSFEDFEEKAFDLSRCKTAIVDYHFENSELNGLEIIERLRERGWKNLVLCTGEYWKPSLKQKAEALKIPVCPKPVPALHLQYAKEQKVVEKPGRGYRILVIDDDETIRMAWGLVKSKLKIETLYTFPSLEALTAAHIDLKQIDIAFVDKNIEHSKFNGLEVIKHLKSNQVPKVVLASGESEETLQKEAYFESVDFIACEKIPCSFKPFVS